MQSELNREANCVCKSSTVVKWLASALLSLASWLGTFQIKNTLEYRQSISLLFSSCGKKQTCFFHIVTLQRWRVWKKWDRNGSVGGISAHIPYHSRRFTVCSLDFPTHLVWYVCAVPVHRRIFCWASLHFTYLVFSIQHSRTGFYLGSKFYWETWSSNNWGCPIWLNCVCIVSVIKFDLKALCSDLTTSWTDTYWLPACAMQWVFNNLLIWFRNIQAQY